MKENKFDVGEYDEKKSPGWKVDETVPPLLTIDDSDLIMSHMIIDDSGLSMSNEELSEKRKKLSKLLYKGFQAGLLTGVISGSILTLCWATTLIVGGTTAFWRQVSFLFIVFMSMGIVPGALFGFLFMPFSWKIRRRTKRPVRNWTAMWILIFSLFCTAFISLGTGLAGEFSLTIMRRGFLFSLISSLIGGYIGGRWFNNS